MVDAYPARPAVFVARFIRLLTKSCVANELGAEAFALLATIAATEDATRYRGPVRYWNGQILPLIGCRSDSAFRRLRDRCERAGWLKHIPGTKWSPPAYWVAVPPQFDGWDDAATDEGQTKCETLVSRLEQASGGRPAGERHATGGQAAHERTEFNPSPSPSPLSTDVPPVVVAPPKAPRKKAGRPKAPGPRSELFDAVAAATGSDPVVSGSHIGKVASLLARADPPYAPEEVAEFGRRFTSLCPWAADERSRPTLGEVEKFVGLLRASTAAPSADPSQGRRSDNPGLFDCHRFAPMTTAGGQA